MKLLADFVLVSGFAVALVILVMLTISKRKELPQILLMFILGLIAIIFVTLYASLHKIAPLFNLAHFFEDGARFMLGPLVYIYIKSIFIKDKGLIKKNLVHFLPFLLYWGFFTVPKVYGLYFGEAIFDYLEFFRGTAYLAIIKDIFVLLYILLSIRLFYEFKLAMKSNYSSFTNTNYGWLRKFLIGLLLATLFDLGVGISYAVYKPSVDWDVGIISAMFLVLVTIYLGYHGLKQSMIHLPRFIMDNAEVEKNSNGQSAKLNLAKEELDQIKNTLDDVLANEKPYLQQELTLNGLAELIGTSDKKLSTLLNHSLNISFYDFINRYRVEEVKEKLKLEEYEKYSLLGLAYTCGFNSKSSFYRSFKKETGISPTTYKKEKSS
ncbi:MAG: helix-turn-helix domain-containing protein [Maribacter sp.]|uniref:helix-turn-helix domain-containing protein n=1 Tax=Maribacter sp. TaxID=1897614 RepID=UPI003299EDC7